MNRQRPARLPDPGHVARRRRRRTHRDFGQLRRSQQAGIVLLGAVQVALAATAWADLARRRASEVRGRKSWWALVIAVNFVGPTLYFSFGRRRL